ncbi:Inner membrane protein YmfA [Thermoflexales bacterium]|nr:Inner membrane protein YmfA [Thermoflexales bacterium]
MHPLFIVFIVIGLGLTLIGLWLMRRALTFKRKAQAAQGRYVDATWRTSRVNRYTAYPVIEFQTADGRTIQFEGRVGVPWARGKVGRSVKVLYDPTDPEEAVVDSVVELWFPALIFLLVGLGWLVTIAVLLLLTQAGLVTPSP